MAIGSLKKQPSEVLPFSIDYAEWLESVGPDTIASVDVEISSGNDGGGDDLVLGPGALPESTIIEDDTQVKVYVGAGVSGVTYKVTVVATTAAGLVKEEDVRVVVREQ